MKVPQDEPKSLKEIGISKNNSSAWQRLADIPEEIFEKEINKEGAMPNIKRIFKAFVESTRTVEVEPVDEDKDVDVVEVVDGDDGDDETIQARGDEILAARNAAVEKGIKEDKAKAKIIEVGDPRTKLLMKRFRMIDTEGHFKRPIKDHLKGLTPTGKENLKRYVVDIKKWVKESEK
ncbi:hypothetical protein MNBD_GAMMA12-2637 [hydrothermal vent metagenome]|uniref:Uncharacterized protein n=1 Tax=hydrothermal vent metagenome TaxID=652676 RepID=A0A3B0Z6F7_9ZZZZ